MKSRAFLVAFALLGGAVSTPQVLAAPAAEVAPQQSREHVFALDAPDAKTVAVAGSFNGWNSTSTPLKKDADGIWRVRIPLSWGKHTYKFVLDGGTWIVDPDATKNEKDGSGNTNSVLVLLPPDYAQPASESDGVIARSGLQHEVQFPALNWDRGRLWLSLRTRVGDVSQVLVRVGERSYPMQRTTRDELYQNYAVALPWNRRNDLSYGFELHDGNTRKYLGRDGLADSVQKMQPFRLSARQFRPFVVPDWVEKSVFYQIFPDRFDNGDKSNDPPDVQKWNDAPTWFNRFGGDARGVQNRLPYLKNLGINAVYFNPVFQSPSNHRYDATDFLKIDPQIGTNAEFARLTRAMKAQNIRTVMDFVFNHTATNFAPFADLRAKGAASAYKNWYFVKSFPITMGEKPSYEAWYGYASMPKLNVLNPPTRDYLLNLVDFWQRNAGVEGLRLDVANEVEPAFWRLLRARAKRLNPQMWIVGEQWGEADKWLKGDQWDAAMNYQFRDAALKFFAEGSTKPSQLTERLMHLRELYGPQVSRNMMNLLSSHDTPRFLTLCKEDARLHQLAATLQFTWIGVPSIYYGEEIGMSGGADPDNRRAMQWQNANDQNPMLQFYKRLIALRQKHRALQSGDVQVLAHDDAAQTFAFSRTLNNETVLVAFNRSNAPQTVQIPLSASTSKARWRDELNQNAATIDANRLKIELAPFAAAIMTVE